MVNLIRVFSWVGARCELAGRGVKVVASRGIMRGPNQRPMRNSKAARPRRAVPGFPDFALISLILALALGADPAQAQELTLDLGDGESISARSIQLILLITVLSIAPGVAIMITCFPFIVTVLSILRQAIGMQQSPPNMLIVSLALFLTYFVMEPVFRAAWSDGISPLMEGALPLEEALRLAM